MERFTRWFASALEARCYQDALRERGIRSRLDRFAAGQWRVVPR